jgi:hypothetical protein
MIFSEAPFYSLFQLDEGEFSVIPTTFIEAGLADELDYEKRYKLKTLPNGKSNNGSAPRMILKVQCQTHVTTSRPQQWK